MSREELEKALYFAKSALEFYASEINYIIKSVSISQEPLLPKGGRECSFGRVGKIDVFYTISQAVTNDYGKRAKEAILMIEKVE